MWLVSHLNILQYENPTIDIDQFKDPVLRANEKYKNHPSIKVIKGNSKDDQFTFESISKSDIKKEFLNLDSTKAIQDSHIITKISKQNADLFTQFSFFCEFSRSSKVSEFPSLIKYTNIMPVHKKGTLNNKNCHPVNILTNLFKRWIL